MAASNSRCVGVRRARDARVVAAAFVAASLVGCGARGPVLQCPASGGPSWSELTSAHFVLQTDLEPRDARPVLREVEALYAALEEVAFPRSRFVRTPMTIVLFRRAREYAAVAPPASGGEFRAALANDLEPSPTLVMHGTLTEATRRILAHELTHSFVARSLGATPPWLNEGWAQYFETIGLEDGRVLLGRRLPDTSFTPGPTYAVVEHGGYREIVLPISGLPPVEALLALDRSSFYPAIRAHGARRDAERAQENNYAAAWSLVHLLMNGPPALRERFDAFVARLSAGAKAKKAFRDAFEGVAFGELDAELRAHVLSRETNVWATAYAPPASATPAVTSERAMAPEDVHLLWARLVPWRGASRPWARAELDEALAHAPASAEAHYQSARFFAVARDVPSARREIDLALRASPTSARYLFGKYSLLGARGEAGAPERDAVVAALEEVATSGYELNAVAWHHVGKGDAEKALTFAKRAVDAAPLCWACIDTLAAALFALGDVERAIEAQRRAVALLPETIRDPSFVATLRRYEQAATSHAGAPLEVRP